MSHRTISVGSTPLISVDKPVSGSITRIDGQPYYRIQHSDLVGPFLMSIVSASDHWMFISSNGALTAGRKNPDSAFFAYYTDDKIHDSQEITGSKTVLLIESGEKTLLWEPFSDRYGHVYSTTRNLYKSMAADSVRFEEINHDINLSFWYEWGLSEQFGFVKRAGITNHSETDLRIHLLDGIQNVLPYGVDQRLQVERSTLVDAYKTAELHVETGLCTISLSSLLVDKPEPAEALRTTTIWSSGLPEPRYLISAKQLDTFRRGAEIEQEEGIRAERGAYFVQSDFNLSGGAQQHWHIVGEINQGPENVAHLIDTLVNSLDPRKEVDADLKRCRDALKKIVASADGLQLTGHDIFDNRHYSNVLFNVMRGGIFNSQYVVDSNDFLAHLRSYNRPLYTKYSDTISRSPDFASLSELKSWSQEQHDAQLSRVVDEYLPLSFSRRHGDPSRPWNSFSIETRKADGSDNLSFEGNWRDIFQNWEALLVSFPLYTESVLAKFLNATTLDGYNPYRITRFGIDWEVENADDPWSHIGYWGDHQIIYLLKLLEIARSHDSELLGSRLSQRCFSFANIPYRIAPFSELWDDPHQTIRYDIEVANLIARRVEQSGADGKLVWDSSGHVVLSSFAEKLLIPVLAKLSNFIPGAGIWMNTQRPEWNDANNALVGFGVSMVTLCYLRRFLHFLSTMFSGAPAQSIEFSIEVTRLLESIAGTLEKYRPRLSGQFGADDRKAVLDELGRAGGRYRESIYNTGLSGEIREVRSQDLCDFIDSALFWIDRTIRDNQRQDGLYHAYNLISTHSTQSVPVSHLDVMLEGQVAVLSSGLLSESESEHLLSALRASRLYRADQHSYLLYPDRQLPHFVEKNLIPSDRINGSVLTAKLMSDSNTRLLVRDHSGAYHFSGSMRNAHDVERTLDELVESGYRREVDQDRAFILELFDELFDHASFTGRSGTFFGYEGLGCIYWHMVSKLLLAVNEAYSRALKSGVSDDVLQRLADHYFDIRSGLGQYKTPDSYGAFPMDPYSHTPGNQGAQQPGMTGQVKEDILCRWGELGVTVSDATIFFRPTLLRKDEFVAERETFTYYDVALHERSLSLPPLSLAFTYCQVPVIYHIADDAHIDVKFADGTVTRLEGNQLGRELSTQVFARSGTIEHIEAFVMPSY